MVGRLSAEAKEVQQQLPFSERLRRDMEKGGLDGQFAQYFFQLKDTVILVDQHYLALLKEYTHQTHSIQGRVRGVIRQEPSFYRFVTSWIYKGLQTEDNERRHLSNVFLGEIDDQMRIRSGRIYEKIAQGNASFQAVVVGAGGTGIAAAGEYIDARTAEGLTAEKAAEEIVVLEKKYTAAGPFAATDFPMTNRRIQLPGKNIILQPEDISQKDIMWYKFHSLDYANLLTINAYFMGVPIAFGWNVGFDGKTIQIHANGEKTIFVDSTAYQVPIQAKDVFLAVGRQAMFMGKTKSDFLEKNHLPSETESVFMDAQEFDEELSRFCKLVANHKWRFETGRSSTREDRLELETGIKELLGRNTLIVGRQNYGVQIGNKILQLFNSGILDQNVLENMHIWFVDRGTPLNPPKHEKIKTETSTEVRSFRFENGVITITTYPVTDLSGKIQFDRVVLTGTGFRDLMEILGGVIDDNEGNVFTTRDLVTSKGATVSTLFDWFAITRKLDTLPGIYFLGTQKNGSPDVEEDQRIARRYGRGSAYALVGRRLPRTLEDFGIKIS